MLSDYLKEDNVLTLLSLSNALTPQYADGLGEEVNSIWGQKRKLQKFGEGPSVILCPVSFTKATRNGTISEKNTVSNLNNSGNNQVFGSKCRVFLKRGLLKRMFQG